MEWASADWLATCDAEPTQQVVADAAIQTDERRIELKTRPQFEHHEGGRECDDSRWRWVCQQGHARPFHDGDELNLSSSTVTLAASDRPSAE